MYDIRKVQICGREFDFEQHWWGGGGGGVEGGVEGCVFTLYDKGVLGMNE